jgi:hypothetical protein
MILGLFGKVFNKLTNFYFLHWIEINAGTLAYAVFKVLAAMGNKPTMSDDAVATIFFTLYICCATQGCWRVA